jgi:PIN domain nuclease of toxin-antitoxin system
MTTFVIDTHALIWFISGDNRLSDNARAILRDPTAQLIIPAIVLAEIKYLASKGRFAQTLDQVLLIINNDPRCLIYPIDLAIIQHMPSDLDIHDGLIVGTALAQALSVDGVLTRDEAITGSNLVPVVW